MTPEELKKLESEHKKAMEGIHALTSALNQTIDEAYHHVGINRKDKK